MDSFYYWKTVLILAIGTLAIRGSIIALSSRLTISDRLKEIFSYIPAAILPAFIAPAVFFHQGHVDWMWMKERFVVLIFATAVCYYFKSTVMTIVFGLVSLYILSFM
ncbi:MAG: AzlD domain-containing protein [Bdellovibrionaceae bacterium]|nr:AzlD domain-containing protein [Pseudobdellovibrionaceae bacterium]